MTRAPVPGRLRFRRRLLAVSTPVAVITLAVAVKLISVVAVGSSAQEHFRNGEIGALKTDVSMLKIVNVIEPGNAAVAAGGLAVLEDRLDAADAEFSKALAGTDAARSCEVRVDLELVRERRGDIDAWEARLDTARERYNSALTLIAEAPAECFAGNEDPDPQRRQVRADAAARVAAKISALGTVAPQAPPSLPPPAAPPAPPAPNVAAPEPDLPPDSRALDPAGGDPLEVLRRVLRDAAAG